MKDSLVEVVSGLAAGTGAPGCHQARRGFSGPKNAHVFLRKKKLAAHVVIDAMHIM